MIAMKREVAARQMNKLVQVFRGANVKLGNWRQVTVQNLWSTRVETTVVKGFLIKEDTHGRVYSHRLSYLRIKSAKRRRLFLWQVK